MFIFERNSTSQESASSRRGGCLRGCLIFLLIYILCSVMIGWVISGLFATSPVVVQDQTVYRLQLKGTLVEQAPSDNPLSSLFEYMPFGVSADEMVGLDEILSNIQYAKNSDKIMGIWLDGGELSMGSASAKAIRDALLDFKKSGKWVVAGASSYNQNNYYVASVADRICLDPIGSVAWHGLSAQKMYYTRILEKIGVQMQIVKVGSYKSAVEPFFRTSMSDADRKQTKQYVDGIWSEYKQAVGQSRDVSQSHLDQLADRYMDLQSANEQLQAGLVDTLVYTQDMDSLLRTYTGTKDYHTITTSLLAQVERVTCDAEDKIAVLYLEGEITDEEGDGIVAKEAVKTLKDIAEDKQVKALVLRVNSPGGSADASEHIWHEIQNIRSKAIPVVVSMGDLAASGGYYISCGADYIYAEPTTLTGSIGIFGLIPDMSHLRDKIGLDIDGVTTNAHSDLETNMIYRGMNTAEYALMQTMVERGYDLFTQRCADGRHMSQEAIKTIGEGRVWLGSEALQIGLVDEMGNIDSAITKAAQLAQTDHYQLCYYPEHMDLWEELFKAFDNTTDEEKLILKLRQLASKSRIMALMPEVQIH